jgi:hypothetical protein
MTVVHTDKMTTQRAVFADKMAKQHTVCADQMTKQRKSRAYADKRTQRKSSMCGQGCRSKKQQSLCEQDDRKSWLLLHTIKSRNILVLVVSAHQPKNTDIRKCIYPHLS